MRSWPVWVAVPSNVVWMPMWCSQKEYPCERGRSRLAMACSDRSSTGSFCTVCLMLPAA